MAADVRNRCQSLRFIGNVRLRIATSVAIELPEEGDLDGRVVRATGAVAMPGAIPGVTAGQVGVNRVVPIRDWAGDYFADFRQNGGNSLSPGRRRGVYEMATIRNAGSDSSVVSGVFSVGARIVRASKACVPGVHTGDLVAWACPRSTPEDG